MTCKNNVSRLISESSFAVILTVGEVTFVVDTRPSQGLCWLETIGYSLCWLVVNYGYYSAGLVD